MISFEKWTFSFVLLLLVVYISLLVLITEFSRVITPVEVLKNHGYVPEDQLVGPYLDSLSSLCNKTSWQQGLYLNCTNIIHRPTRFEDHGDNWGTFNLRSELVSCLRWAIDSGMGLILPPSCYSFRL